ncbi:hypothetical protein Bca101_060138 [Brassica carinata]
MRHCSIGTTLKEALIATILLEQGLTKKRGWVLQQSPDVITLSSELIWRLLHLINLFLPLRPVLSFRVSHGSLLKLLEAVYPKMTLSPELSILEDDFCSTGVGVGSIGTSSKSDVGTEESVVLVEVGVTVGVEVETAGSTVTGAVVERDQLSVMVVLTGDDDDG